MTFKKHEAGSVIRSGGEAKDKPVRVRRGHESSHEKLNGDGLAFMKSARGFVPRMFLPSLLSSIDRSEIVMVGRRIRASRW